MPGFDFIEAYRKAQPSVAGEIVDARKKSHDKLFDEFQDMRQVYELCQLAFELPHNSGSLTDWFQPLVKEFDPRFALSTDKAEAAHISALLLRDLISRGNSPQGALAVLVCSFGGKRAPIQAELLNEARGFLAAHTKARKIVGAETKIAAPAAKDIKALLDAMSPNNTATFRAAIDAVIADSRNAVTKTALSANEVYSGLRQDLIRLAEEVDMLWWHIGDWSELIDEMRTNLPAKAVGTVSGIELGRFVRSLPGPLGAFGLLRRTLGKQSDKPIKLKDVVDSLGNNVAALTSSIPSSATSVFPIHAAIHFASESDSWATKFDQEVGLLKQFDLSQFDMAVQAFRERSLIQSQDRS